MSKELTCQTWCCGGGWVLSPLLIRSQALWIGTQAHSVGQMPLGERASWPLWSPALTYLPASVCSFFMTSSLMKIRNISPPFLLYLPAGLARVSAYCCSGTVAPRSRPRPNLCQLWPWGLSRRKRLCRCDKVEGPGGGGFPGLCRWHYLITCVLKSGESSPAVSEGEREM